jgi:hypothetical protein
MEDAQRKEVALEDRLPKSDSPNQVRLAARSGSLNEFSPPGERST